MAQGLRARRGGAARARLSLRAVHAPLLRRVPRPARDRSATSSPRTPRAVARQVAARVRGDIAYMRDMGWDRPARCDRRGRGRCATTPAGRCSRRWGRARSACPRHSRSGCRSRDGAAHQPVPPARRTSTCGRTSPAPPRRCAAPSPDDATRERLHIAWLIPPFRRGSGGHMTIFTIVRRARAARPLVLDLGARPDAHDPRRRRPSPSARCTSTSPTLRAGVFSGFDDWHGADVAFATGWQTAYPLWTLGGLQAEGVPGAGLRARLLSRRRRSACGRRRPTAWAIRAWPRARGWRSCCATATARSADAFELGVDHDTYRPLDVPRDERHRRLLRAAARRRAARPSWACWRSTSCARGGPGRASCCSATRRRAGAVPARVRRRARRAGRWRASTTRPRSALVISLTNYSRMPKEMMACGLPVVDVRHPSVVSVFARRRAGDRAGGAWTSSRSPTGWWRCSTTPSGGRRWAPRRASFVQGMTWAAAAGQIERIARRRLGGALGRSARAGVDQSRSASVPSARR